MPRIDPGRWSENFTRKVAADRVEASVSSQQSNIKSNAKNVFAELYSMEVQVRQVLNGAGVPTIQYPFYLCFGREMWALINRGINGESLVLEAKVLVGKWKARGLTEAVLQAIHTDVFNVAAPIGP